MGFFGHPELILAVFTLSKKTNDMGYRFLPYPKKTNDMGYGFLPYPKKTNLTISCTKETNLTISCTKKNQFARFHVPKNP